MGAISIVVDKSPAQLQPLLLKQEKTWEGATTNRQKIENG
jgi:hypothetical protein